MLVYPHAMEIGGSQLNALAAGRGGARPRARGDRVRPSPVRWSTAYMNCGCRTWRSRCSRRRPSAGWRGGSAGLIDERGIDVVHGYEWPPVLEAVGGHGDPAGDRGFRHRDVDVGGAVLPARGADDRGHRGDPRGRAGRRAPAGHPARTAGRHRRRPPGRGRPPVPRASTGSIRRCRCRDDLPAGAGAEARGPARRVRRGRRAGRRGPQGAAGDRRRRPQPRPRSRSTRHEANDWPARVWSC